MLESLRDAMDDLHYVNALHEGRLPPTRPIPKLPDREIAWYINNLRATKPEALELENICAEPLGFFLFTKFLRKNDADDLATFLIESATLQMNRSNNAARRLRNFVTTYMLGDIKVTLKHSNSMVNYLPTLCRHIEREDTSIDEEEIDEEGQQPHVSIRHRRDNSLFFAGNTVERLLSKLGVSEKPGKTFRVTSFDENEANGEDTLNLKELVVLDNMVFGILNQRYAEPFSQSPEWKMYFDLNAQITARWPEESDFEKIRVIGKGGFGIIHAVKSCTTGKLYAMKIIDKRRIKRRKAEIMCIAERDALEAIDSPFVVSLKYAFHSSSQVFLVLDLMMGGDLCFHLRNSGCFNIEQTRYYAARTLLGLSILHLHGFVYRDLKPENILLDSEGYSKITDMGLAKFIDNKARGVTGICGTRGYWAPEMLLYDSDGHKSRYSFEVDWFSLGCCIYEFLLGVSPFRTEAAKLFGEGFDHTTRAGKDHAMDLAVMEMDPDLTKIPDEDCKDLLTGLLNKNPHRRLGAKGFQEIAHHRFFHDIPWDSLHRVVPPFKPGKKDNVVRGSEMGSFEDEKEIVGLKLDHDDQEFYSDWNYISKKGAQEELVEYFVTAAQAASQGNGSSIHHPFSVHAFKPVSIHPYQISTQAVAVNPEVPGNEAYNGKENTPNAASTTTSLIDNNHHHHPHHPKRRTVAAGLAEALLPRQYEYYDAEGNVHGGSQCCAIS